MTTNVQYFPLSSFKMQPSAFMTPALLKRLDMPNGCPVEYVELPGDNTTSTRTGFYFEGAILYPLKANGDVTWSIDYMPISGDIDGSSRISMHVDVAGTTANAGQSLATIPFQVNPTFNNSGIVSIMSAQRATVSTLNAASLGFFGQFFRFSARIYRVPLDTLDQFRGSVGVLGVWAQYDDV